MTRMKQGGTPAWQARDDLGTVKMGRASPASGETTSLGGLLNAASFVMNVFTRPSGEFSFGSGWINRVAGTRSVSGLH